MALNQAAKKEFIDGMVEDFESDLPDGLEGDAKDKMIEGQRKYAERLCDRIVSLIKNGTITNVASGTNNRSIN